VINVLLNNYAALSLRLKQAGDYLGMIGIRLVLAWEFREAGVM